VANEVQSTCIVDRSRPAGKRNRALGQPAAVDGQAGPVGVVDELRIRTADTFFNHPPQRVVGGRGGAGIREICIMSHYCCGFAILMTGPPADTGRKRWVGIRGLPLIHDKTVDEWGTRDSGD